MDIFPNTGYVRDAKVKLKVTMLTSAIFAGNGLLTVLKTMSNIKSNSGTIHVERQLKIDSNMFLLVQGSCQQNIKLS